MGQVVLKAPVAGSVWMHAVATGQRVEAGALVLVLEVMKMEFPIETPKAGRVTWLAPCNETLEVDATVAVLEDVSF